MKILLVKSILYRQRQRHKAYNICIAPQVTYRDFSSEALVRHRLGRTCSLYRL